MASLLHKAMQHRAMPECGRDSPQLPAERQLLRRYPGGQPSQLATDLKNRQQRVVIDGQFSSWVNVRSGVPQGSVLGPLLFVLFINDIVNVISSDTNILLYADDMKIWRIINTAEDQLSLQSDINNLHQWSIDNKMKFHPSKCNLVRSALRTNILDTSYHLDGTPIALADNVKDLGVMIHPKLLYNMHHKKIVSESSQRLGLVKRNCSITKCTKMRKVLYLSLVRSLYEHCSNVWRPTNPTQIEKFERIQKKGVKWVFNDGYARYSKLEYFNKLKQLKILPINLKFELNDMIPFHKIFYDLSVVKLPSYLITRADDHDRVHFQRETRTYNDNDRLKIKCTVTPRVNAFKNTFFHRAHLSWNKIPFDIRSIENPDTFKTKLEKFLWLIAENEIG